MKNTKELKTLLGIIYCINRTNAKDKDIEELLQYTFMRVYNSNTNLLSLYCSARNKEDIMPEIMEILKSDTKYMQFTLGKNCYED